MSTPARQVTRTLLRNVQPTLTRSYTTAVRSFRPVARSDAVLAPAYVQQSVRGKKTLKFGSEEETVVERSEYPPQKLQQLFSKDTFAVLGMQHCYTLTHTVLRGY